MENEHGRRVIVGKIKVNVGDTPDFDAVEATIFESLTSRGVPTEAAADVAAAMAREFMDDVEHKQQKDEQSRSLDELIEAIRISNAANRHLRRHTWVAVGFLWGMVILGFLIDGSRGLEVYLHW